MLTHTWAGRQFHHTVLESLRLATCSPVFASVDKVSHYILLRPFIQFYFTVVFVIAVRHNVASTKKLSGARFSIISPDHWPCALIRTEVKG